MSFPSDRQYSKDHEWFLLDGDIARVGITSFATEALGDIVFVDPPAEGTHVTVDESCGEIESTKSVSEIVSPATGEVVEANGAVVNAPETINSDPYGEGWLYSMRVESTGDLLDAQEYAAFIAEEQQ